MERDFKELTPRLVGEDNPKCTGQTSRLGPGEEETSQTEPEGCLEAESPVLGQSLSLSLKPSTDWRRPTHYGEKSASVKVC